MNFKPIRIFFITFLAILFLSLLAIPVFAQETTPELTIQARAAFDGYYKYGEWLPIWVTLENRGADLSGEIIVRVPGSSGSMAYAFPADMPSGSRKRLPVFVLANNYSRNLRVSFESGQQAYASTSVTVQPKLNNTFFIGIASPQRGALNLLNGIQLPGSKRQIILFDFSLDEIPPRSDGLRSMNVLIINSMDTSQLSIQQSQALENWVLQGGRLVLGGGALAQETVSGLLDLPLPLIPSASQEYTDISNLQSLAGEDQPSLPSGSFIVSMGEIDPQAIILAGDQNLPLVLENQLGKGSIDLVNLDLSQSPFEGWSGTAAFWGNLLAPGSFYSAWMSPDMSTRQQMASQMAYGLQNLPVLDLPSVKWLAILLGIYILVIGPINYLVLRKKNRLHYAWFTIPLLTLIFSIGAFSLGYALHGSDLFVNKIALIEASPGAKSVSNYIGLFSPAMDSYEIEIPGDGLISPMSPYYNPWDSFSSEPNTTSLREVKMLQSDPGMIKGISIDQWSMQSFMIEGLDLQFGQITADLSLSESSLRGEVNNLTGYPLSDLTLIFNQSFQRLGDLQNGESTQVNLPLTKMADPLLGSPVTYQIYADQYDESGRYRPNREIEVKRIMLESLFQVASPSLSSMRSSSSANLSLNQAPVLIGWIKDLPPQVTVNGAIPAQQSTAMVYSQLTYNIDLSKNINLPTGTIPGSLVVTPLDGGSCGPQGSLSIYIYRGEAEFEFSLPAELKSQQIQNLIFGIYSDGSITVTPVTYIYDYGIQDWINLENLILGENLITANPSIISPTGLIRLRLASTQETGGCYFLGMGIEANRTEP